ncbi:HAT1 isoform 3 [Pan troglodytes]|uniref:Histone acetyltransferase 1 n=3 Tax=Hominidae TaxID=9604 RepID=F8W9G7_HUMAN|nr:histone acetyltransferase 1 [Homo sapiens]KAI4036931.1 histone acetyltransferase 1 [Homo sapiens]PNI86409.1 HAT1 isoform 3 [Pan troglodytes]PNJ59916.1 HAT1 isoform 2 [Pongo abelii]
MAGFGAMEKFLVEYKSAVEKKLAEYKCNTNTAIELKLVRFPEDLENDIRTFFPEYTHQLFGDEQMMLRAKLDKSFHLDFAQTRMISFLYWKRKLISSHSEPYFIPTQFSVQQEEKTLPFRYIRLT